MESTHHLVVFSPIETSRTSSPNRDCVCLQHRLCVNRPSAIDSRRTYRYELVHTSFAKTDMSYWRSQTVLLVPILLRFSPVIFVSMSVCAPGTIVSLSSLFSCGNRLFATMSAASDRLRMRRRCSIKIGRSTPIEPLIVRKQNMQQWYLFRYQVPRQKAQKALSCASTGRGLPSISLSD